MLLGVYLSENFWNSAFLIMQLQAGLQAVVIHFIEIVSDSMGMNLGFVLFFSTNQITSQGTGTGSVKVPNLFKNSKSLV